jgi:hypothetical protein
MFYEQTRIYNDTNNITALEDQSKSVTDYPFQTNNGIMCPNDSYDVLTTSCTDWHVGSDQVDVESTLRQQPTTQNYYNRSQIFLTGTAPFKGAGGYDIDRSNNILFTPGLYERKCDARSKQMETDIQPWTEEFVPNCIPVQSGSVGGESTRACVRNQRNVR